MEVNETRAAAIRAWAQVHALLVLGGGAWALLMNAALYLVAVAAASFVFFVLQNHRVWGPVGFGAANAVTTVRLLALLAVGGLSTSWHPWVIAGIALAVLLTDRLDGYLARTRGTASTFGAYLDMETDAFYVCLLSLLAFERELLPWPILIVGFLRYAYVVVLALLQKGQKPEPRSFFGQLIAVIMMSTLIGAFVLPWWIYQPAAAIAGGLIAYSFGKSFVFQVRG